MDLEHKHKYAMDYRSYNQYRRNVEKGRNLELEVLYHFATFMKRHHGIDLIIEGNGRDKQDDYTFNGDFNDDADYKVNGVLMEIKTHKDMKDTLTLKESQRDSYLQQGARILWVNGYETKNPLFTVIKPKRLQELTTGISSVEDPEWRKKVYRIRVHRLKWNPLFE